MKSFRDLREKTLTPAEKKKREEIAKAMERDNPGMDMKKKMAIATWQAKKVAEETLDEGIENMPHGRLKWHMNTGVPHGSYTKAELKKERDRRLSRVDTHAAYKKAKASMNEAYEDDEPASPDEASMALRQLGFIKYAAEEVMDHIKSGKEFPEWMQNKLSKLHGQMESLHSALGDHGEDDEDMKEAVMSADKKPEKYVKPDGKVGIRMVRTDKKVVDKNA